MHSDERQRLKKVETVINALLIAIALLTLTKLIWLRARRRLTYRPPLHSAARPDRLPGDQPAITNRHRRDVPVRWSNAVPESSSTRRRDSVPQCTLGSVANRYS